MTIYFRCGHAQPGSPTLATAPTCATCGERVVSRVTDLRAPKFVGHCRGPYAEYQPLDPVPGRAKVEA